MIFCCFFLSGFVGKRLLHYRVPLIAFVFLKVPKQKNFERKQWSYGHPWPIKVFSAIYTNEDYCHVFVKFLFSWDCLYCCSVEPTVCVGLKVVLTCNNGANNCVAWLCSGRTLDKQSAWGTCVLMRCTWFWIQAEAFSLVIRNHMLCFLDVDNVIKAMWSEIITKSRPAGLSWKDLGGLFRFFPPSPTDKIIISPLADMLSWAVWFKFLLNKVIANTCLFILTSFSKQSASWKVLEICELCALSTDSRKTYSVNKYMYTGSSSYSFDWGGNNPLGGKKRKRPDLGNTKRFSDHIFESRQKILLG